MTIMYADMLYCRACQSWPELLASTGTSSSSRTAYNRADDDCIDIINKDKAGFPGDCISAISATASGYIIISYSEAAG